MGGVHDALDTPAFTEAAVPVNPENEYVMVCENELDAADMVIVPELPMVKLGTVIVDALGIVVRARDPLMFIVPGRIDCDVTVDIVADTAIVFVPSLL